MPSLLSIYIALGILLWNGASVFDFYLYALSVHIGAVSVCCSTEEMIDTLQCVFLTVLLGSHSASYTYSIHIQRWLLKQETDKTEGDRRGLMWGNSCIVMTLVTKAPSEKRCDKMLCAAHWFKPSHRTLSPLFCANTLNQIIITLGRM